MYREWAPGAVEAELIGDFNNWQGARMERDDFGTWTVKLPDGGPCVGGLWVVFDGMVGPMAAAAYRGVINGDVLTALSALLRCPLPPRLLAAAGAIPHNSRLKVRLRHPDGWWVDRIPAWARRATGACSAGLLADLMHHLCCRKCMCAEVQECMCACARCVMRPPAILAGPGRLLHCTLPAGWPAVPESMVGAQ